MKISKRRRRVPSAPINAMSDIAFLLLIFIMLISLINYRQEIKIDYPVADHFENVNADANLEIWVNSDGQLFYKGQAADINTIQSVIADAITRNPATRIHILADRDTAYKEIDKVVGILQLLQHRLVSLVVRETEQ